MLLVTKSHHERDEEKAVDKNQAGDIGSVSSTTYALKQLGHITSINSHGSESTLTDSLATCTFI